MDKLTARRILEDYFEDKADPADYQAALDFLVNNQADPASPDSPATYYQQLINPGGIDCETSQALMLTSLDPFDRLAMSREELEQLQTHLAGCLNCKDEYEALLIPESEFDFDIGEVRPRRTEKPQLIPVPPLPGWPKRLKNRVDRLTDKVEALLAAIHFEPAGYNLATGIPDRVAELAGSDTDLILFDKPVGKNLRVNVAIHGLRPTPTATECTVQVVLRGPSLVDRLANHPVILSYDKVKIKQEALTDARGQVSFPGVPVSALSNLRVSFEIVI